MEDRAPAVGAAAEGEAVGAPAPAPQRTIAPVQQTLAGMFALPARAPATVDAAQRAKMAADAAELKKTAETAAAALAEKPASPAKKTLGWLKGRVEAGTNTRGVKEVVLVVECATVPTSYWRRKGGRQTCPSRHPFVLQLGYMMLLKDAETRWLVGGKDLMCTNCFALLRSPASGEENLKTHLKTCNKAWWEEVKKMVEASSGRRAKPTDVNGELALSFDERMELNMDCALTFAALGNVPLALVDNEIYIEHQRKVSDGKWVPPGSRFIGPDGPSLEIAEDQLIIDQKQVIDMARVWYKGISFAHGSTDAWTARGGTPFLGTDFNFLTPWLMSRTLTGVWQGDVRYHVGCKLQHLEGSHNGERIALSVAGRLGDYGIVGKPIELIADSYKANTDLSDVMASWVTDCGGGVPAAPRRLGSEQGECSLHRCDSTLLNVLGLAQKHCPVELIPIRDLFKKCLLSLPTSRAAHARSGTRPSERSLLKSS